MQKIKYSIPNFLCVLSILILLQSCSSNETKTADAPEKYVLPDSLLKTITIDSVRNLDYSNTITLTGQVDYDEDHVVKIYPMVSGIAESVQGVLGNYVNKGDVLAVLRSSDVTGYSSDLVNAESNYQIAKRNEEKTISMYKSGLASQVDSVNAVQQFIQAKSDLEKSKRILQNNGGSSTGEYVLRAPISGFVVERNINDGMAVRADNSSNLFTISDLNTVWVMANVYESNISYVKNGDSVNITTLSYPGKIFRGKIDKIMNVLDPDSRVMKVRIVMNNPGYLLKPQMFASVSVDYSENKKYLAVPSSSLVFADNQNYVLIYNSPSDIVIVPVQVIGTKGNNTFISGNVQEGQHIIATEALLIYQQLNS
ncbi:MAG: efflux RND transporter periplasmic adaptor subunit [Arachidicoccus sp.]|nr:efflux RND transporter periplasmic adaptor subunit [Arachidicoccus sp.]